MSVSDFKRSANFTNKPLNLYEKKCIFIHIYLFRFAQENANVELPQFPKQVGWSES